MAAARSAFSLRRLAAYLAGVSVILVGVYALAGFVLVPYLIERMAPPAVAERLHGELRLHHVAFNPFTLRLTLQGVTLQDSQGQALASIADAVIDLEAAPLLQRELRLSELQLTGPWLHLGIDAEGELNLARLVAAADPGDAPGASAVAAASDPWHFTLDRFRIRNGVLHVSDRSGTTPAATDILPINLAGRLLSTRPDGTGAKTLALGFGDGGRLTLQGEMTLTPPAAKGQLTIVDYSPRPSWSFLRDVLDLDVPGGRLNAAAQYEFAYTDGRPQLRVADLQLQLSGLHLQRRGAASPLLELQTLALEDGRFDLDGNRFQAARLRASSGVVRALRQAGGLDWEGIAAPPPAPADSAATPFEVALDAVELDGIAVRFEDRDQARPVHIGTAALALGFGMRAQGGGDGVELSLEGLRAELEQASLTQADAPEALLTLERVVLNGGALDLADSRVGLAELQLQGGRVLIERSADGRLNWQQVWSGPAGAAPAPAPVPAAQPSPWRLALQRFTVADLAAVLTDRGAARPVVLHLTPIGLEVTDFTSPPEGALQFRLDAALQEGGRLGASGQADLSGPAVAAELSLQDITLLPLQAYLADVANVSLNSGRAALQGRLDYAPESAGGLRFAGMARVDDLAVTESAGGATLVAWQALQADELALAPGRLTIKEVLLEQPAGKFIINPDMTTNWQAVLKTPAAPAPAAADGDAGTAKDFLVEVGRVRVRDGALNFGDLSLRPQFQSEIHALNGSLAGLSTAPGTRASADLKGRVDEFGSATIRGELQPAAPREFADIQMAFQNIDLAHLTPYSAKFAGYRIAGGKLSLDLGYKVQAAQLQGNNQIIVDRLTLGEKVDSPDAFDAPLELAIALLEDANGRIDIGLPVSGDLNEPQFSFGHLVWKALGNLITKAITAPFRALAGALGVEDKNLDSIAFAPGDAALTPPEQEKLATVVKMLAARPKLALEVQGRYAAAEDGAALRTLALHRALLQQQGVKLAPGEAPGPVSLTDSATRDAVAALFSARLGAEALARARQAVQAKPEAERQAALYDRLYQQLRDQQPLPPDALAQLARARGQAIVTWLQAQKLPAGRVQLLDPAAAEQADAQAVASRLNLAAAR